MLKAHLKQKIIKNSFALLVLLLLSLFPKQKEAYSKEDTSKLSMTIPVYTLDKNGYVARINPPKDSKTNDDIKYIVSLLTINSESSINLPEGFIAVIPEKTKLLNYQIKDGILQLNFSKELLNMTIKNEEIMIESLIFSLCELSDVKQIQILVENQLLEALPSSHRKLPKYLSKEFGINKRYDINDIKNTHKATIYYLSKYNNGYYYIPITKITNQKIEAVELIVKELKTSPIYEQNLISYLNASYELQDYQILEDTISISFNNQLIANLEDQAIEEKVKYTLALSLRDTYHINDIKITLNHS